MTGPKPLELFEWLPVLALALGRREITTQQAAVALFVALSTKGTTGAGGTVDMDRLETELALSRRQVWRHFRALVEAGWLEQTVRPTRGGGGERGRRARYRLTHPRLVVTFDTPADQVSELSGATSLDSDELMDSCDSPTPSRVTVSTDSCDTATPVDGTVPPSDGSPSDGSPLDRSTASATDRAREQVAGLRALIVTTGLRPEAPAGIDEDLLA